MVVYAMFLPLRRGFALLCFNFVCGLRLLWEVNWARDYYDALSCSAASTYIDDRDVFLSELIDCTYKHPPGLAM